MSATNAIGDASAIPPEARRRISDRLDAVEAREGVRLLLAVEAGSRAWSFPSPDSDYDVRFLYGRPLDWYLTLEPGRDVIEEPIEADLDINGWDVRKALLLAVKPNPVLLEWLRSPIVYREGAPAVDRIRALAGRAAHQRPSAYHYFHLCGTKYRVFSGTEGDVRLKKYFYALRPALALRWLRLRPHDPLPMDLPSLRAGLELDPALSRFIDDLLEKKRASTETGIGPRSAEADSFIAGELARAEAAIAASAPLTKGLRREADALFREIVKGKV